MIDWWLLVSMFILILSMAFHTVLAHVVSKCKEKSSTKSIFTSRYNRSTVGTGPGITSVGTKTDTEHDVEYIRAKTALTRVTEDDELETAKRINNIGKIVYAVLYLIFNIVFWVTAISEYVRPAEEYINNNKLTF